MNKSFEETHPNIVKNLLKFKRFKLLLLMLKQTKG